MAQKSIVSGSFSFPSKMLGIYYFHPLTETIGFYGSFRTNFSILVKEKKYRDYGTIDVVEGTSIWNKISEDRRYASFAAGVTVTPSPRITGFAGMSYASMVLTEKFDFLNQFGAPWIDKQELSIYKPGLSVGLISHGFDNRIQMMIGYDTFPKGVTFGLGFALRKYD
jgi:hypothetical protein